MARTAANGKHGVGVAPASATGEAAAEAPLPEVRASVWTKVGDGGRIVIPAEIREILGLREGSAVLLRVEDGELHLLTSRQAIGRAQELARPYIRPGISLVDELIAERRAENARDEEESRAMGPSRD
jgi:AbrB family looped-hinge helix DNA binding protein